MFVTRWIIDARKVARRPEPRERRFNIYKRPLGGVLQDIRVSSEVVGEAAVGTEGRDANERADGAGSTSASNSTPKSHRPKWRINIYY